MGNIFYFSWEPVLMTWLQNVLGDTGAVIATFVTILGEETVMVAILGFIYWCYDKKFGVYVGTNLMVGLAFRGCSSSSNDFFTEKNTGEMETLSFDDHSNSSGMFLLYK